MKNIEQYPKHIQSQIERAGSYEAYKAEMKARAAKGGKTGVNHFATQNSDTLREYQLKGAAKKRSRRGENSN